MWNFIVKIVSNRMFQLVVCVPMSACMNDLSGCKYAHERGWNSVSIRES